MEKGLIIQVPSKDQDQLNECARSFLLELGLDSYSTTLCHEIPDRFIIVNDQGITEIDWPNLLTWDPVVTLYAKIRTLVKGDCAACNHFTFCGHEKGCAVSDDVAITNYGFKALQYFDMSWTDPAILVGLTQYFNQSTGEIVDPNNTTPGFRETLFAETIGIFNHIRELQTQDYDSAMKEGIRYMATRHCSACDERQPNQLAHLFGGCLDDNIEEIYRDSVVEAIEYNIHEF